MAAQFNRRRWFQWRLRTLIGVVTVCAVVTAFFIAPRVRAQAVVAWLREQEAGLTLGWCVINCQKPSSAIMR